MVPDGIRTIAGIASILASWVWQPLLYRARLIADGIRTIAGTVSIPTSFCLGTLLPRHRVALATGPCLPQSCRARAAHRTVLATEHASTGSYLPQGRICHGIVLASWSYLLQDSAYHRVVLVAGGTRSYLPQGRPCHMLLVVLAVGVGAGGWRGAGDLCGSGGGGARRFVSAIATEHPYFF